MVALIHASPQNLLRRAKEARWLDAQRRSRRASLDASLVAVTSAQVALDSDFLAQFVIATAGREDIERAGSGAAAASYGGTDHWQRFARSFGTGVFGKPGIEALPGATSWFFILDVRDRDGPIRTAFRADAAADTARSDIHLPVRMASDARAAA